MGGLPSYRQAGGLARIFGMMCQGNLLGLDPDRIYLYSNTLQAIAMGYLISAMLFLHVRLSVQIGTAVALLLAYWGSHAIYYGRWLWRWQLHAGR